MTTGPRSRDMTALKRDQVVFEANVTSVKRYGNEIVSVVWMDVTE